MWCLCAPAMRVERLLIGRGLCLRHEEDAAVARHGHHLLLHGHDGHGHGQPANVKAGIFSETRREVPRERKKERRDETHSRARVSPRERAVLYSMRDWARPNGRAG